MGSFTRTIGLLPCSVDTLWCSFKIPHSETRSRSAAARSDQLTALKHQLTVLGKDTSARQIIKFLPSALFILGWSLLDATHEPLFVYFIRIKKLRPVAGDDAASESNLLMVAVTCAYRR